MVRFQENLFKKDVGRPGTQKRFSRYNFFLGSIPKEYYKMKFPVHEANISRYRNYIM